MTETVNNGRSNAVPGALLGAAAGAGVGYLVDSKKPDWNFVKTQKYTSYQDLIKEKADAFTKAEASQDLKDLGEARTQLLAKRTEIAKSATVHADVKTEYDATVKASKTLKTEYEGAITKLKEGKIEGFDTKDIKPDELEAKAKEYLKAHKDEEVFKTYKDALKDCQDKAKALGDKVKSKNLTSARTFDNAKWKTEAEKIFNGVKDNAAKVKGGNKWLFVAAAAGITAIVGGIVGSLIKSDNS